jgi:hypothetical protein
MRVRIFAAFLLGLSLTSVSRVSSAQGIAAGSFEISGSGGITNLNGVDSKKGHGAFGFTGMYNLTRDVAVGAEYNYLMLGSLTEGAVTENENLQMYGALARVAIFSNRFVAPYAVLSGGGNRLHASASEGNESASASQSGGYISAGGGVSIFLGHGFGIRPEYRYERQQFAATTIDGTPVSGGGQSDMRGTVALFYQFGAPAPKPYSSSK